MHLIKSSYLCLRLEPRLSGISFQIVPSLVVMSCCFFSRLTSVSHQVLCNRARRASCKLYQASCTMRMPIVPLSSALLFSLAASSLVCRLFLILSFSGWKPTYWYCVCVPGMEKIRPFADVRLDTESMDDTRRTIFFGTEVEFVPPGGVT
jgi:hypothetical protein